MVTRNDAGTPVTFDAEAIDLDCSAELPAADAPTWYYVRARQTNGALIYASPVFVDVTGGT